MEVGHPTWSSEENAYSFPFTGVLQKLEVNDTISDVSGLTLPQDLDTNEIVDQLLNIFLEKTKRYFVTPLQKDSVKKHLRHYIATVPQLPKANQFYRPTWSPVYLKLKSNEFSLFWSVDTWTPVEPLIRPDFFRSKTPTQQQSPEPQPNVRKIQIQNALDSLVPVGDLPLSDLPPLNFGEDTPEKREVRRRIREARLKVELAKLKAKRMEQKYYERYGEVSAQSDESSLESSESDSDEHFGKYSYS